MVCILLMTVIHFYHEITYRLTVKYAFTDSFILINMITHVMKYSHTARRISSSLIRDERLDESLA